jgi:hypothetical protein
MYKNMFVGLMPELIILTVMLKEIKQSLIYVLKLILLKDGIVFRNMTKFQME